MKRLLLPLLVSLALPIAVNATNYLECEAINSAIDRWIGYVQDDSALDGSDWLKAVDENETIQRLYKDAKKRGCFYIQ
jgi:hypothetical protein